MSLAQATNKARKQFSALLLTAAVYWQVVVYPRIYALYERTTRSQP